jgi:hypothetical protein
MNRIILLGCALGLLSGCAEFQQMHNEQVARDCQAGIAQQRGQRDGALGNQQDSNWFNFYCPAELRKVAVQGYLQGYQAGVASQGRRVVPAVPPVAPRPQVLPPRAIVVPDYNEIAGRQIAPPQVGIVVPDYNENAGRQIAPPEVGIVVPDYNELAGRQIAPSEVGIVVPDYNENAGRQIAPPEVGVVVPDYNEWAVSPPVAAEVPVPVPLPEVQEQPLMPEMPAVVTFDEWS